MSKISASSPDQGTNIALLDPSVTVIAGDGALPKEGLVLVTKGSAAALTLATPTAGLPSAGGDDGRVLRVVSTTAFAHVVTASANKINDGSSTTKDTATFPAHAGGVLELVAYNGLWYALIGSTVAPAVLTEV